MAPIHDAVKELDLAALQRELDAGVSPDLVVHIYGAPLRIAIVFGCALSEKTIEERLACVEALLEAGASVDVKSGLSEETALHSAASRTDRSRFPADFELIVDRLLLAGADVNAIDGDGDSVLAAAALEGCSTTVAKLLSAGAVDPDGFDTPLRCALDGTRCPRSCALLMRAGAVLTKDISGCWDGWLRDPYLLKIVEYTGGFRAYALAHRQRLTAIFLPKFPSLPAEIVSHIVSFGFNLGCYEFDAAPVIEPVAHRTRSKGG